MKKFEKEELIKIFEDQIDGIQRLRDIRVTDPREKRTFVSHLIRINYSVSGADVLRPSFDIEIFVQEKLSESKEIIVDYYELRSESMKPVIISNEDGAILLLKLKLKISEMAEPATLRPEEERMISSLVRFDESVSWSIYGQTLIERLNSLIEEFKEKNVIKK